MTNTDPSPVHPGELGLNLRHAPAQGKIIGFLPRGATVTVSGEGTYRKVEGIRGPVKLQNPDGTLKGGAPTMTMLVSPNNAKGEALGDGATTDEKGRYYITTELGIQVFDQTGRHSGTIALPFPGAKIVSCEFAGKGHDTLFVCAGDRIFRRKTKTRGAWQPGA